MRSYDQHPPFQSLLRAVEHGNFVHFLRATTGEVVGSVVKQDTGWKVFPSGYGTHFVAEGKFDGYLILLEHYKQINGLY